MHCVIAHCHPRPASTSIPPQSASIHNSSPRPRRVSGDSGILVAAVANFPLGTSALEDVLAEVNATLDAGADEIDVVFPFRARTSTATISRPASWYDRSARRFTAAVDRGS